MDVASPSSALAASRQRTLRRLRAVILLAFALPLLALVCTALLLYRQAFVQAEAQLDAASRIAQEHALKMLETNEMVLARMLDLLGGDSDAELLARSGELHERLNEMAKGLPQVQGLFVHGADSRSLGMSRVSPPPRQIDYSDREWYLAHRAGEGGGLFITEQLRSRATGEAFFDMSRRRVLAGGRFGGSVHISLRPEYLTAFWHEMASNIGGLHVGVVRADGRFLARWPGTVPSTALNPGSALMQRITAGMTYGQFQTVSSVDAKPLLMAFRKLGHYPLYVGVAFDRGQVLAAWGTRVALLALFVVPLACALAWMAWVALKRTREELDAVQRLEEETARRTRTELALAQSQKLETVGQLAGGVAHDFNNLLMIVGNNLHLLRRRGAQSGERELAAIERAVGTGARLTRQLLSLSGRQALAPERIALQERLPTMLSLVRAALPGPIELQAEVAPDTAAIMVDAAELELALINLALNARDAMEGRGRLTISVRNAAGEVAIEVADEGSGMEAAVLERVGEPFFTTKRAGKGSGLGLAQVRSMCRAAGGRMEIDSRPGAGTRVRLLLPRAAVQETAALDAMAAARRTELHCTLLLVEDNDALATTTAAVLESLGCQVRRVENARLALDAVDAASFDVVLSDIEMPGRIDGIELAARLGARQPPLPVVLMSGYAARIDQARARGLEVLAKPCSPAVLRAAIAAALATPRQVSAAAG